ncbi:MAG: peptidylprolyl isomerase [Oscillospiraceae bacterium]|nr:peptidylprolyl isomerase [Oscillospiraceae bacterium]
MTTTKKLLTALIILTLSLALFAGCADKNGNNGDNEIEKPGAPSNPANTEIPESDPGEANYAIISVRGFGEITIRLHPEYAPNTVPRFVENVRTGFYNGRNFHRVVTNFMIQGGSFDGQGGGDPTVEGIFTEVHPDARHYYGAICLSSNSMGYGSDSFYIVNNKDTQAFEAHIDNIHAAIDYYQTGFDDISMNAQEYVIEYGQEAVDETLWELEQMIIELNEMLGDVPSEVRARYAEVGGAPQLDDNYTVFGYTIDGFDVIDAISAVERVFPLNGGIDREPSQPVEEIIIEWIIVKTTLD